jgi:5,10-methylenetetrahydromethanopterin reductase
VFYLGSIVLLCFFGGPGLLWLAWKLIFDRRSILFESINNLIWSIVSFGLLKKIGLGLDCKIPLDFLSSISVNAEKSGFDSLWAVQYYYFHDPYMVLSAVSSKTSRIKLGTAVVNIYDRFPLTTATQSASLQELSSGRFTLGIGSSVSTKIEDEMGIEFKQPLKRLAESVRLIREFLTGEPITFQGDFLHVKGSRLGLDPPKPPIPIYMAAVGPKALKLAATIGDGVILDYGTNIDYIDSAVSQIRAVKDRSLNFDIASLVWFMPEGNPEMINAAKKTLAAFFSYPGFGDSVFPFLRVNENLLEEIRRFHYLPEGRTDLESASALISDDIVRSSMIIGRDEIPNRVEQYNKAGVDHVILMPYGGAESALKLVERFDKQRIND